MKKHLLFLICFLLFFQLAKAQTTVTIGTDTTFHYSSSSPSGPIYIGGTDNGFHFSRHISIYTAAEIIAGGGTTGLLQKIRWNKVGANSYEYNDGQFKIYVKHTSQATFANSSINWANEVSGATLVYNSTTQNIGAARGWQEFTFDTPFAWNGTDNLEIFVDWYRPGDPTGAIGWRFTTKSQANASTGSSNLPANASRNNSRPNVQLVFIPITANDAAVTAITSPASPVAPGTSPVQVTLRNYSLNLLTTATIGWSVNGIVQPNFSWAGSLGNAQTSAPVVIGNFNFAAGLHKLKVWSKNPNNTADINPANDTTTILVNACTASSGTYTINKNGTAGGTNFTSFAAALQSLNSCGVSGPVVFNVVAGSGPYNEQISLTAVPGASATNPITFNGNNNVISFASTSANRSVISLTGADHITIRDFRINATDPVFGWGIHLSMASDFNTISNNTITISATGNDRDNAAGIVFSNSKLLVDYEGNAGTNNIVFGNTVTGGYTGIHVDGSNISAGNNRILNNTITDFYSFGIAVSAAKAALIEGNNISRPTLTTVGTFYGIHVSNHSIETIVSRNRIHNSHDASGSGSTNGLYISVSDAPSGQENIFVNNLIYNLNGSGSTVAIYNSGSSGAHYFYNTIHLDRPTQTGTTSGFHQSSSATNIKFINNIITMHNTGGGSSKKYAIDLPANSPLISNNNIIYITPASSSSYIGISGSGSTAVEAITLTDWKAVKSGAYDQNSISVDPIYTNTAAGDFIPTASAANNTGQSVPGITVDFSGATRNTATPDAGAYEHPAVSGIMSDNLQKHIPVYPNPSSGIFHLNFSKDNRFQIEITDMSGKILKTQAGIPGINTINLTELNPGIYLLNARSDFGKSVFKLLKY